MTVQQDQLSPANTTITFETINNSKADRVLHNGTDYIKCEFQADRPTAAYYIPTDSVSGTLVPRVEYVDRNYESISPVNAYYFQVEYPEVITVSEIKIYTTTFISNIPTTGDVQLFRAYTSEAFLEVAGTNASYTFRSDLSPQQYEYKITLDTPVTGKFWKFRFHVTDATVVAKDITEIVVSNIPSPKIIYYQTNGNQSASFTTEKEDILDLCYDITNDKYYTVRFNNESVGSALDPDDDFTTVSGTTEFNNIRWSESSQKASFFRSISNNNLIYSTTSGDGLLHSNYKLEGDLEVELDFNITTLSGSTSFFGINSVHADTDRLMYGVGVTAKNGDSYYKVAIPSFTNSTTSAELLDLQPNLESVYSGTETWTVTYNSSSNNWSVHGSINGLQTEAETGELYENTYMSFQISAAQEQVNNDSFVFSVNYEEDSRAVSSGLLNVARTGSNWTSSLSASFDETIDSSDSEMQIFGVTNQPVNISADNFEVITGTAVYPDVPVFTIDKVDSQGNIVQEIVEQLNVIKDPTKTYNDYTKGGVQIAVTPSEVMYVKVLGYIYRLSVASPIAGLVDDSTPGVSVSLPDIIPQRGVYSFSYSNSSGGFLWYSYYDSNTQEVQIKTLSAANPPAVQDRDLFLDISDWSEQLDNETPYQLFTHAIDNDTLFFHRRNGDTGLNSTKIDSNNGVAIGSSIFTDSSEDFLLSDVKKGDLLIINESAYADNGTYTINNVNSSTSITVSESLSIKTGIDYTIVSNAEFMQFNTDPNIVAFSAVNVEDFSLRAGTSDTTNVNVEVIGAWGDPLNGKTVNYVVGIGDGFMNPAQSTTSGSGLATSQYQVGTDATPVRIDVTISD